MPPVTVFLFECAQGVPILINDDSYLPCYSYGLLATRWYARGCEHHHKELRFELEMIGRVWEQQR
jgi:hypothetical protein